MIPPAISPADAREFARAVEAYAHEQTAAVAWATWSPWAIAERFAAACVYCRTRGELSAWAKQAIYYSRTFTQKDARPAFRALAFALLRAARWPS